MPRVRHGVIRVPAGHATGRVTVLVGLRLPPLATVPGRGFRTADTHGKLSLRSSASRAYLARLSSEQAAAFAQIVRAIPQARLQQRSRILLDALALTLPYRKLPALARLSSVRKVYPSLRYHLDMNKSPGVIHADALWAGAGDFGQGVKIGIVDDGIDKGSAFFNPSGFSYPAGFPKGQRKFTTPKVIVARSFPGPRSGKQGRLPLVRSVSFHGTHVAGIASGVQGTVAPPGPDHPLMTGLSGIAPRAWLGNYRVFNAPVITGGYDAFTPQIVEAYEAVVNDGMNVLNSSGGGPEVNPANDALIEAADNVAAAGVVPVISAGNDRDDFGLGSVGTPSTAPDAISVAAVTNDHTFAPALGLTAATAPANLKQVPFMGAAAEPAPASWGTTDQVLIDPGTIVGTDGKPVDRFLCGKSDVNDPASTTLPGGSLNGTIALVFRGFCTFDSKARRARAAGAVGILVADNRPGEATIIPQELVLPGGMVSDLDGARLRDYLDSVGGRSAVRIGRAPQELPTNRSGVMMYFSSAGPSDFTHQIKPDLAAPGGQILSSTLPEFAGSPFAVFDGTSMAAPHVSGAAALLLQLHPGWTAQQVKSALVSTAGPAWANTARTIEAPVQLEGGGLINVARANDPKFFTSPVSLAFDDLDVTNGPKQQSMLVTLQDAAGGGGDWTVEVHPQVATNGSSVSAPGTVTLPPFGLAFVPVSVAADANAANGDDSGFIVLR